MNLSAFIGGNMGLRTQIIRGQAISWVLVLLVAVPVAVAFLHNQTVTAERRQAQQQILQLDAIQSDVLDLETGLRGYLVTDVSSFLQPFDTARGNFNRDVNAERALLRT